MVDVHVPNLYIIIIPFITRWRFDWNVHIMYMLSNQGVGLGGWLQQIFNAKWKSLEVRDEMMMMMTKTTVYEWKSKTGDIQFLQLELILIFYCLDFFQLQLLIVSLWLTL